MYEVGLAPSAERDIERIYGDLQDRAAEGLVYPGYPDQWFEEMERVIERLADFPERHPYAPERAAWGRDVRNALLKSGYRVLFEVYGDVVWVMRSGINGRISSAHWGPAVSTHRNSAV